MALDGLTLRALSGELHRTLEGCRVQHIYHPLPHAITLRLWSPRSQQEHTLLVGFDEPPWFHLTQARLDNPLSPSSFCMLLRKHLKNGFVESIAQDGWERIVDVAVRRPDCTYVLRAELMGRHGNVVLMQPQKSRLRVLGAAIQRPSRPIRPGDPYTPPEPQPKLDPLHDDLSALASRAPADEPLWRWLLEHLQGVGPGLAKELPARVGINPKLEAGSVSEIQLNALWAEVRQLFSRIDTDMKREDDQSNVAHHSIIVPHVYLKNETPMDATAFAFCTDDPNSATQTETLSQAFDLWLRHKLPATHDQSERTRLLKHLNKQIKKTQAALDHVRADQRRAGQYEHVKREADLIMIHLQELESGSEVQLPDPETNEMIEIRIDPQLTPVEAAQKRYARYKKLKRGVEKLGERQEKLQMALDYLQTAHTQVEQAETPAELNEIAEELGVNKPPDPRKQPTQPTGPRRYEVEGFVILVGRNSRQNDEITRKAQPEDLWLHARQRPGSHVVVQTGGDAQSVPDSVRLRAAQLAAYYSRGRHATKVPVICTRAKFLKKPKGAKPGLVLVSQEEQTLLVNPSVEETE